MSEPHPRAEDVPNLRLALARCLARADDVPFLKMLWALNALQTDRSELAIPFFRGVPSDAATNGILVSNAIYPWELETLGNELLAQPKESIYRTFDFRSWPAIADLVNLLRNLEGAEYSARRGELHMLRELGRIGARQFEWQRQTTGAEFYRSAFIYGQGECAKYFFDTYGISVADMTLVGFALMAVLQQSSTIRRWSDLLALHEIGVESVKLQSVFNRIGCTLENMRSEAKILRHEGDAVAYKPSIFRKYPCLFFGPRNRQIIAPLPDLIVNRVTSGLFYDVVGGGGVVRDDYGRRFEAYASQLLSATIPQTNFEREWPYKVAGTRFNTPDIIACGTGGDVRLVIECKASKMSIAARFGEDPSTERGYDEMAKGVFQTWRFFSHCRRGFTGRQVISDAKCLLLTLDDWFTARGPMLEQTLLRATAIALKDDPEISVEDQRPVAFCSISELEIVVRNATQESFYAAIDLAASVEKRGWMLTSLHQELDLPKTDWREYPFNNRIDELLPWWQFIRNNPSLN